MAIAMDRYKLQAALGFWIILSPWVLGFSGISLMKWSNTLVGTVIFLINIWKIFDSSQNSKS